MRFLLPVLLLASLGLAQIFGPAGVPLSWDFGIEYFKSDSIIASKFTSPSATSYMTMDGDTLFVVSETAGDADIITCLVEADGTKWCYGLDDSESRIKFDNAVWAPKFTAPSSGYTSEGGSGNWVCVSGQVGYGLLYSSAVSSTIKIDANAFGQGTLQLGETGDKDINYLNGRLQTNITTVAVATTMGASDGYMYTMTANDTLRCPTTPLAGEVLMCKFTNAAGGWIKGMGNTIDGASEVAASENDNIRIVWNATTSDWEIR